jgi:hypothetical protein
MMIPQVLLSSVKGAKMKLLLTHQEKYLRIYFLDSLVQRKLLHTMMRKARRRQRICGVRSTKSKVLIMKPGMKSLIQR